MKKLRYPFLILFCALFSQTVFAQVPPSSIQEIEASVDQRQSMRSSSIFKDHPIRSVGPTIMSGRVSDVAVHPDNDRVFYVGYASGGVYKTTNGGIRMQHVFDHQGALGIGDLAISKANPEIIWVGTGENNSSRSSYAGNGVYKSSDGGDTWMYAGLRNTQHIGRIVTHPSDENTAWVASIGALYSNNAERGVFKTIDGGNTWTKTLFVNDSTGVIDLIINPDDPNVLYAAAWERDRKAWNFKEGGNGSAIYKSTDGGVNWSKLTNGLPQGDFVGRIGLDISQSNPNTVYAVIDNQFETKTERPSRGLSQSSFTKMSKKDFLKLKDSDLERYLRSNRFPAKYTAESVKADVESNKYQPRALADYLGDANAALFNTDIEGAEIYRSDDAGASWEKVNEYKLERVFNTYGYYFGQVRVDPNDPETIYTWGVPIIKSTDGGKTWFPIAENGIGDGQGIHVDHHSLWINPDNSNHLLLGNDGGLYESYDGGENFIAHNTTAVGQFYAVSYDMEEPYNIYGGLQDNGTFYGSSRSVPNRSVEWSRLFGGDGMHVYPDLRNPNTVYVGFQYGNYSRLDRDEGKVTRITPVHELGEDRYRYNWNSPIAISHHNQDIIYFGSQRLNRSLDRGNTWEAISPDLTHNLPNGDVPYSTLTTIAESPLKFNVIWVGSDDGRVHVTMNGGGSWNDVSQGLPERFWVSEVHASKHDAATAYVSLNGYRFDNFETHIYKTTDYGKNWKPIKGNLPDEVTNVILQDPFNAEILYAGLDHGTYVSFNDGGEWHYLANMPNVATYDLVIHPREKDLIAGTHGRSIYVMDIEHMHTVADRLDDAVTAMEPASIRSSNRWGQQSVAYRAPFMPNVPLMYYLGSEGTEEVEVIVSDDEGKKVHSFKTEGHHGFNQYNWNLMTKDGENPEFLEKGEYTLTFKVNNAQHEVPFSIK